MYQYVLTVQFFPVSFPILSDVSVYSSALMCTGMSHLTAVDVMMRLCSFELLYILLCRFNYNNASFSINVGICL